MEAETLKHPGGSQAQSVTQTPPPQIQPTHKLWGMWRGILGIYAAN